MQNLPAIKELNLSRGLKAYNAMNSLGSYMATNPAPSWHIPVGLNFLFRNFESKIRIRAMLLDETLMELSDTDIGFKGLFYLTL